MSTAPPSPEPAAQPSLPPPANGASAMTTSSTVTGATLSPTPAPQPEPPAPQTQLTLLLLSGSRKTFSFAPETTVGRVKELVWGSWPNEWREEPLPPSPSYFRLLHLGRMLQDDSTLQSNNLSPTNTPQIVHLSIKAFVPPVDAGKGAGKKKPMGMGAGGAGDSDVGPGDEGTGCCGGCVVM